MAVVRRLAAAALLAGLGFGSPAAAEPALEYAVKANFLYKFAPFVTWPPQAFADDTAPFAICVAGADPFGPLLDNTVRGQRIGTHPIVVRRLAHGGSSSGCHILYVGDMRARGNAETLQAAARQPVLTVSDGDARGGTPIIRFVVKAGRVRFVVDRGAASAAGVTISSKLLDLAVTVEH